ncbi:MAG: hypothetical protein AAFV90_27125 [Cyanobacteria bacterium J06634_5]
MATLNPEEQAILESVERGEWEPVENMAQEIQRYQSYAQTQHIETVSISLPSKDLQTLQTLSQQSGVTLDSLIASVLRQYAAGQETAASL